MSHKNLNVEVCLYDFLVDTLSLLKYLPEGKKGRECEKTNKAKVKKTFVSKLNLFQCDLSQLKKEKKSKVLPKNKGDKIIN